MWYIRKENFFGNLRNVRADKGKGNGETEERAELEDIRYVTET